MNITMITQNRNIIEFHNQWHSLHDNYSLSLK